MKYTQEEKDGVVVISLKSSLEGGPDTFQLKDEVKTLLSQGKKDFLLNMADAGFVNSTGIGVVVAMLGSVKGADGRLKVCSVTDRARRAFVVTGVWQLFDAFDTASEAMESFKTGG